MSADPFVTVEDFAHKYRVHASVVRWWIKCGYIKYRLVGTRKMIRVSDIVKPIIPEGAPIDTETGPGGVGTEGGDGEGAASQIPPGGEGERAGANIVGLGLPAPVTQVEGRDGGTTASPVAPERRVTNHRNRR